MADEPLAGHIKPSEHINRAVCVLGSAGTRLLAVARDRRGFITLLGGVAAAWPLAARAATGNAGNWVHQRRVSRWLRAGRGGLPQRPH